MTERRDGWEEHRREQLRSWLKATPAERLAAVEELIEAFGKRVATRERARPSE
jgi:hypothetical protein